MRRAESTLAPRLLLLLALIVLVRHLAWSLETPVAPNSDRFDYLARAQNLLEGRGPRAGVEYPLRFAFEGAQTLPALDVVRPPLWPMLIAPALSLGGGEGSGSWPAFLCALAICFCLYRLAGERFGSLAGAGAALAFALSFATRRALWGGGPELALGLLVISLWAFAPVRSGGGTAHFACASLFGAMPALHPTGWIFAGIAALARPARYGLRWLPWMFAIALLIATPWYLRNALSLGIGGGALGAQAELAKSLDDPGGLGPYVGLEATTSRELLRESPGRLLHLWLARVKQRLIRMDAWLSWPFLLLAIWGMRADWPLARRDLLLMAGAGSLLLLFSGEARLLLPLLPIAAVWAGAGADDLCRRGLPWPAIGLLAIAPWLLPLGAARIPGEELATMPEAWRRPAPQFVEAIARAKPSDAPILIDSSLLGWRSGRAAIFVPREPSTLQELRERPALSGLSLLALGAGRDSRWIRSKAWQPWLDAADTLHEEPSGALLLRLPQSIDELDDPPPPGPGNALAPDLVPRDLIEIPQPPATREGIRLREPCWQKLQSLLAAADSAQLPLRVLSGYRSHAYQQRLYRDAQRRHGDDQQWVAAPGESEHQLGEALDLADAALAHVLEQSFGDTPEGSWLRENSRRFGFRITYTRENERTTGIRPEPWHIRCVERH